MRILVVTQYFWPENFRINDLCVELAHRGHEITVLTGKPNYPDGVIFDEYIKSPQSFDQFQGCDIVRVPMVVRGKSSVRLIFNYVSYFLSASFLGGWKLRGRTFDVIFVYEPSPVTVCLPALFLKKLKKVPVVFLVLDLWPETLEAVGVVKSMFILRLVGGLVSFIYNRCDLILGQSKAFYSSISRYCNDAQKIKYFPGWAESIFVESKLKSIKEIELHDGVFKILFAGNIGDSQDFPSVLKAMHLLKSKKVKVKLFVAGDGRAFDWLKLAVAQQDLADYITLLGRKPLDDMPSYYAASDALLVSLRESPVFSKTIPGKVQSYMAAAKPILTMLSGEGSRVIDEAGCGLTAKSGDYEVLAENIIEMVELPESSLHDLGRSAVSYAKTEFDRDTLVSQLESWFVQLVSNGKLR